MKKEIRLPKEEIEVITPDQIHKDSQVFYQAPTAGLCKLTKLSNNDYGFIYLQRPDLSPVFVSSNPKKAAIYALQQFKSKKDNRKLYKFDSFKEALEFFNPQ